MILAFEDAQYWTVVEYHIYFILATEKFPCIIVLSDEENSSWEVRFYLL